MRMRSRCAVGLAAALALCPGLLAQGAVADREAPGAQAGEAAGPKPAGDRLPPEFSAWYRFESPSQLGRSTGPTPWPAVPHEAGWIPPRGTAADPSGTSAGAVSFGEPGRWGGALWLPGKPGAGLYLPNPAAFFGPKAAAGTVALWARAAGPAGASPAILFDFMVSTGNTLVDGHEVVLYVSGDELVTWPALARRMVIRNPLAGGQWTHLALTWDAGSGAALYVDGRKAAESGGAFEPVPLASWWPGRVGCHTVGGGYAWAGAIDELRLFNRALDEAEVAQLCEMDPALPAVEALLDGAGVYLRNTGTTPVQLALDRWLPATHLRPPWEGYLPIGWNTTGWTAGVCPAAAAGEPFRLAPGESRTEPVSFPDEDWGPGSLRVLAGEGLAAQELPLARRLRTGRGDRAPAPEYGLLDRDGLRIELLHCQPAVFPAGRDLVLPVRITNDLGRDVEASGTATLTGRNRRIFGRASVPLALRAGAAVETEIRFRTALGLGPFEVWLTVRQGERDCLLWRQPVYGTSPEPPGELAAVGAACVRAPDDEELLRRMASDGVGFVRLGGKGDGASLRHNLEAVLAHGMKAWLTPAFSYQSVCADPDRRAAMQRSARDLGAALRGNTAVLCQSMAGEGLGAPPCYCTACTAAFRDALRSRYGSLRGLNRAWGSAYTAWEQVQQLGSPGDVDQAAERLKMMQVALELPADSTQRWVRLFELDRPRGMDWRRWHDDLLLSWYRDFAAAFHETNRGTVPVGEQPCWPNFKTHVFFPLEKYSGMGGMDLYLPGEMQTTLGYAAELFLNFDLNASLYANARKPVMVHEMYVQDLSPAGLAEAQGWWLAGRGYNLTTFFTYDYYYEGRRAGLPLVFGLFDNEGKPYPCHESFKRFSAEFFAFAAGARPGAMRRVEPRVAVFLGDDISLANILETGGATWEADGVKGHNGSYWLTERCGHAAEFVNDATLGHLDRERVLVVPWCPVIAPRSVEAILGFARKGGTVLIDGPFARFDPQYRPYPVCPGAGAAEAIGVRLEGYEREENAIALGDGSSLKSLGVPAGVRLAGRAQVLFADTAGRPAVVGAPLGRGRVVWLLSALGPVHRERCPDSRATAFWGGLLEEAGLRPWWRFRPGAGGAAGAEPAGQPLFDVSARIRDDRTLFVFAVSFFAPVSGTLALDLPEPRFSVQDALTGQPLAVTWEGGTVSFPLDVPAFGARVLRVQASEKAGRPLAEW